MEKQNLNAISKMILTQEEINDLYNVIGATFNAAKDNKFIGEYEVGIVTRLSSNRNCKFVMKLRKSRFLKRTKLSMNVTPIFNLVEITDDEFLDQINNTK